LREALAFDFKGSIFYGTNSVASQVYRGQLIEKIPVPWGNISTAKQRKKKKNFTHISSTSSSFRYRYLLAAAKFFTY
jgi:hypothetical protein